MSDYAYDPEIAPIVPLLPTLSQWDDLPAQRLAMLDMIRQMSAQGPQPPAEVSWEDRRIPGPAGAPEVTVRLYRSSKQTGTRPAVLYLHGGGFCFGSIETEHVGAAVLCDRAETVIASIEYRLPPEHPFPAGLEDCYAALQWLHAEAGALEVDPARIAVSGQSAGGGLAAALALLARDRGGPALCFQMLGIPELDDRLETPSMKRFTDTPLWNRPNAVQSWKAYLGDAGGEVSPYAAPARAEDLAGLPPTFVSTMEFDPLRDEGIQYALRLLEHGVAVELHQYPGTFHGSSLVGNAGVSKRANRDMMDALSRALRR